MKLTRCDPAGLRRGRSLKIGEWDEELMSVRFLFRHQVFRDVQTRTGKVVTHCESFNLAREALPTTKVERNIKR